MIRKLGKQPKRHDPRTLKLSRYLPTLPTPPAKIDHAALLPADVGMMDNDTYGDCAVAAPAHMVQSWTLYANAVMQTIPDADILAAYKVLSPNDMGCNMLDVLNYWRKTGIGGDKSEAFIEAGVADLTQAKLSIQYFGSLYIGMSLPDVNTFGDIGGGWLTPTGKPNPSNGHAVCLVSYDDTAKEFIALSWGEKIRMSYAWYQKYCDECYAVLNDIELSKSSGKSPEGFDWVALQDDLNHIGDAVTPVPTPSPITSSIAITAVGGGYWVVVKDGLDQTPQHTSNIEAAEHAVNVVLANPKSSVTIRHAAVYNVTSK